MPLGVYPEVYRRERGPHVYIGRDDLGHQLALHGPRGSNADLSRSIGPTRPRGKATQEIYGCDMPFLHRFTGMNNANSPYLFTATAFHSRIFLVSLYLSGEFERWSANGQRCSLVDREMQVGGLNRLGRCECEVLVHVNFWVHKEEHVVVCSKTGLVVRRRGPLSHRRQPT